MPPAILFIFAIVLLGVLFVETIIRIKNNIEIIQAQPNCGLHDWILNEKEEMICCHCGKKAGIDENS